MRLSELGIEGAEEILRGSLSVVYTGDGPLMGVPFFMAEPPPPRAPIVPSSAPPPTPGGCFDLGLERVAGANALGGRFGGFASGGSSASVDLDPDEEQRRVLRLRCARNGGPCGLWVQLFERGSPRGVTYLDVSGLATLSLWARVGPEGAGVTLKTADAAWERREDALPVGDLAAFAPGGRLGPGWTRVTVPLAALPEAVARDSLANFVFEVTDPGETEVELAGAQLCRAGVEPGPLPAPRPPRGDEPAHHGLWVWNTRELLADEEARARFLAFVEGRFDRVFLHLPPAAEQLVEAGFVPFDGEVMGALVAEIGRRGALVYALDGDPSYALPGSQAGVLRTVEALLAHNRGVPPERRFHGVRYDVEPYLVPGWAERREELLSGYLDLLAGVREITARGGLEFGVDLPFWLDNPEDATGRPLELVWRGEQRPVLEHVVRLVDDLAVMDYRTAAFGSDGSLVLALGELDAAAAAGVDVYIGLETGALLDEDLSEFQGPAAAGLPPAGDGSWVVVESLDRDRDSVRIWLVQPGGRGELLEDLGRRGVDASSLVHFRADPAIRVAAERLSFRDLGRERMEQEAARLLRELGGHPAFAGLAYHHYGAMSELIRRATPPER